MEALKRNEVALDEPQQQDEVHAVVELGRVNNGSRPQVRNIAQPGQVNRSCLAHYTNEDSIVGFFK